jgi:hypothetical protein
MNLRLIFSEEQDDDDDESLFAKKVIDNPDGTRISIEKLVQVPEDFSIQELKFLRKEVCQGLDSVLEEDEYPCEQQLQRQITERPYHFPSVVPNPDQYKFPLPKQDYTTNKHNHNGDNYNRY